MVKTTKQLMKVPVKNKDNNIAIVRYKGKFTMDKIRAIAQNTSDRLGNNEGYIQTSIKFGKDYPGSSWKSGGFTKFGSDIKYFTYLKYPDEELEDPPYFSQFDIIIMGNKSIKMKNIEF